MAKSHRIGTLKMSKPNAEGKSSPYLSLGNMANTDPNYNRSVEIIVKDNNGKVVLQGTNIVVFLNDPRLSPNVSSKLPEWIKYELSVPYKE